MKYNTVTKNIFLSFIENDISLFRAFDNIACHLQKIRKKKKKGKPKLIVLY